MNKYHDQVRYQFFLSDGKAVVPLRVTATPTGRFFPQRLPVSFEASLGTMQREPGVIKALPVFGVYSDDYLAYAPCNGGTQNIGLAGETVICLSITSLLSDLETEIDAIDAKSGNPYWQSVAASIPGSGSGTLLIPPASRTRKAEQHIELHMRPKFFSALGASLAHLNSNSSETQADDQITCQIHYSATVSKVPMQLEFSVPVQFYPGLPQLCLAAMLGGIIGVLLRSAGRDSGVSFRKQFKPLAFITVWSVLFELLGLLLWTQNARRTNVVILGLDCNPSQLVPALLMGVIVGLAGLRKVEALFQKLAARSGAGLP
jgi:hypothetical protein